MFFLLSKIFQLFVFPFSLFLFFSVAALFYLRPSLFRWLFGVALLAILLLSNPYLSGFFASSLENRYLPPEKIESLDAVIVLSGGVNPLVQRGAIPEFNSAADRVLLGEELLRKKKTPVLLISGGNGLLGEVPVSEARIVREWLLKKGYSANQVLAETESRNTAENAIESAKIINKFGWKRVLLITSAFHMHRSVLCFNKQGISVIPYPVDYYSGARYSGVEFFFPDIMGLYISTLVWKEYLGIFGYWLKGYI